ncbi:MAG TPA: histidine kinase N-terminal 7TM domain-containing protein [Isosphaeraceae bacterium]|jgi:signal transduction histidine kinase|nr:histidine kinase N-terminal 7TM domain-containing protein [Isosphaeraceae bacterium]
MAYQANPTALPFLNAAVISAGLAAYAWQRRRVATAPAFAAMMAGETAWALGMGIELLAADPRTKALGMDLTIVGKVIVPVGLLMFTLGYTGLQAWVTRRTVVLTCALPLTTVLLHWTNPWHHLFWKRLRVVASDGYLRAFGEYGPWFWVHAAYCYALMALSIFLLARAFLQMTGVYRRQVALILFGAAAPWVVNAAYIAGLGPYRDLDLTATVFCLTGLAIVPGLLRYRILDLIPVARDAVVQGMREVVLVLDPMGRVVDLNLAAQRLLGRRAAEVVGGDAGRAFRDWPELVGRLAGLEEGTFEAAGAACDGGTLYEVGVTRLDDRGRGVGSVVVLRDISERRRAERERECRIEEQVARSEAEAAGRAKDRFLAALSHELRTPLTPALALATALLDDPSTPEGLRTALEAIRRNIELEARLIDDLLDVNRLGRGLVRLDREAVDVHALIEQALGICRADLLGKGLRVVTDLAADARVVDADPTRLLQVFWNLIKNAVKFTPPGGSLAVRSWNVAAADEAHGPPVLVVEVSDTGIGIEPALLPRVFEPFVQGEAAAGRRLGGLGLGLAIGRSVVEAHGGRIEAASAGPGRGSTFRVELPTTAAAPVAETQPRVEARNGGPPGRRARVLLAEDNEDTRTFLALILRQQGYQVRAAASLAQALEAAAAEEFDLVVSDIELGDGSGLELLGTIRATRPTPGVALSGFGSEDDVARSLAVGFSTHLTKPVDVRRLTAAIEEIMQPAGLAATRP